MSASASPSVRKRLKCRWKDEIRTVVLTPEFCDFLAIKRRLSIDWGFPVSLKYKDCDGDLIILNTQNDFDDLVQTESAESINVLVYDGSILNDPGKRIDDKSGLADTSHAASVSGPSSSADRSTENFGRLGDSLCNDASQLTVPLTAAGDGVALESAARSISTGIEAVPSMLNVAAKPVESPQSRIASYPSAFPLSSPIVGSKKTVVSQQVGTADQGFDSLDSPLSSPGNSLNSNRGTGRVSAAAASQNLRLETSGGSVERSKNGSSKKNRTSEMASSRRVVIPANGNIEGSGLRWKRGDMLGQGAFGVVYLGLNVTTGELMAVKQMSRDEVSSKELSSLENEINLLRGLCHRNIVRYIGTEMLAGSLSIFLEYVPGGSLKALIDKFGKLEDSVAKTYTRQLLMGLEYLHTNGIAHRDIKGANCLVGNDGVCKLADFGNSKHWRNNGGSPTGKDGANSTAGINVQSASGDIKGTPSWMAPEVIREQGSNQISWRKADVWSLACTTLEMVTGKPPWSQFSNSVTILYHIACQETLPEYPGDASVELKSFLSACLQRDPSKRPDTTSLLLHSFVASNINPGNSLGHNSPMPGSRLGNGGFSSPLNRSRNEMDTSGSFERLGGGYASPSHRQNMMNLGPPGWYSSHGGSVHRPHSVSTDISNSHATLQSTRARGSNGNSEKSDSSKVIAPTSQPPSISVTPIGGDDNRELTVPVIKDSEMDNSMDASTDSLSSGTKDLHISGYVDADLQTVSTLGGEVGPSEARSRMQAFPGRTVVPSHNVPRMASPFNSSSAASPALYPRPVRSIGELNALRVGNLDGDADISFRMGPSGAGREPLRERHTERQLGPHDGCTRASVVDEDLDAPSILSREGSVLSEKQTSLDSSLETSLDDSKESHEASGRISDDSREKIASRALDLSSKDGPGNSKRQVVLNDVVVPQKRVGIMGRSGRLSPEQKALRTVSTIAEGNLTRNINKPSMLLIPTSNPDQMSPPASIIMAQVQLHPLDQISPKNSFSGAASIDSATADSRDDYFGRNRSDSFMSQLSYQSNESGKSEMSPDVNFASIRPPLGQIPPLERPQSRQDLDLSTTIPISRINSFADTDIALGSRSPSSPDSRNLKQQANNRLKELNRTRSGSNLASLANSGMQLGNLDNRDNRDIAELYPPSSPRTLLALRTDDTHLLSPRMGSSQSSASLLGPIGSPIGTAGSKLDGRRLPRQSPITIQRTDSLTDVHSIGREVIMEKAVRWGETSQIGDMDQGAEIAEADAELVDNDDDSIGSRSVDQTGHQQSTLKSITSGLRLSIPPDQVIDQSLSHGKASVIPAASPIVGRKNHKINMLSRIGAIGSYGQGAGGGDVLDNQQRLGMWNGQPISGASIMQDSSESPAARPLRKGPLSAHARMTQNIKEKERERGTGLLSGNINVPSAKSSESLITDGRELYHGATHVHLSPGNTESSRLASDTDTERGNAAVPGFATAPALMGRRRSAKSGHTGTSNTVSSRAQSEAAQYQKDKANKGISNYYQKIGQLAGAARDSIAEVDDDDKIGPYLPSPIRTMFKAPHKSSRISSATNLNRELGAYLPTEEDSEDANYGEVCELTGSHGQTGRDNGGSRGHVASALPAMTHTTPGIRDVFDSSKTSKSSSLATANLKSASLQKRDTEAIALAMDDLGEAGDSCYDEHSPTDGWERPHILTEHTAAITRLRCPRLTDLLISSSLDGTVRIWSSDVNRRSSLAVLDASVFNLPPSNSNGDHRVVGKGKSAAVAEDLSTSTSSPTPVAASASIIGDTDTSRLRVRVSNVWAEENCASVWAACSDHALRVWSGSEFKPLRYLRGHEDTITCMEGLGVANSTSLSGDTADADNHYGPSDFGLSLVATGSADKTLRIWDTRCKKAQIFLFKGHSDTLLCLRWGEGGRSVITAGKDKTVRIWDTRAGRLRVSIEKHFGPVATLRAIPENLGCTCIGGENADAIAGNSSEVASFASGGRDSVINLWTGAGACVGSVSSHRQGVHYLSDINLIAHSGKTDKGKNGSSPNMFSIGGDGLIKIWDLKRFKSTGEINVGSVYTSGDSSKDRADTPKTPSRAVWAGQSIVSAHGRDGSLALWHGGGIGGTWQCKHLAQHGSVCTDLISTNRFVASSSKAGHIFRWAPFSD